MLRTRASRAPQDEAGAHQSSNFPNSKFFPGALSNSARVYSCCGAREHRRGRAVLDHLALVHHGDAVADLRGDAQVVGDEQHREIEALADLVEQLEHLRLHRDVERRDRLVGDQHLRLHRERARDADALALAAGELVRVARRARRVEADQAHQLARALAAPRSRGMPKFIGPSMIAAPTVRRGLSER